MSSIDYNEESKALEEEICLKVNKLLINTMDLIHQQQMVISQKAKEIKSSIKDFKNLVIEENDKTVEYIRVNGRSEDFPIIQDKRKSRRGEYERKHSHRRSISNDISRKKIPPYVEDYRY